MAAAGLACLLQSHGINQELTAEMAEIAFSNLVHFINSSNYTGTINTIMGRINMSVNPFNQITLNRILNIYWCCLIVLHIA